MTAEQIIEWLEKERNVLQNTGSLMWNRPKEQAITLEVAKHIDMTLRYISESKKQGTFPPVYAIK
jgi:hypothetical protein